MIEPKLGIIPLASIDAGARSRKAYPNIKELASDIETRSLMHPLVVKEKEDGGYLLLAGGRRLKAITSLGWKEVPCNIYPIMDEYDTKSAELAENIQREDLTYAERAELVRQIHQLQTEKFGKARTSAKGGHSLTDTAAIVGMSQTSVRRDIKLAEAIEAVPELAKCKDASQARKLINRFEEQMIREELAKRADTILSEEGQDAIKRQLINSYVVGDFFEKAKDLPSKSFHCIEVDSPYGVDYVNLAKDDSGGHLGYNEVDAKAYPEFLDKTISECRRLLYDDGWLLFWFAAHRWYIPVLKTLEKHGFTCRQPAVWAKPNGATQRPDQMLASAWEPFFYGRKGNAILFKQGRSNVFSYTQIAPVKKTHPTERPIQMMQDILECFAPPSARIVVPFAGSGNTLLAANNLGMTAVGFDLSTEYKNAYVQKVMEGELGKFGCSD